ncbi:MAG: FAD/FMN-containing dehydrogenase [Rhodobacteraceae bacterium HLUCCA12]|nr:MAG: FAD/FMN-containing dehydrogenase [Rhodobacteraceae bacterium HLUCCA12]
MELSGWGRYPRIKGQLHEPRDEAALAALLQADTPVIARGLGRSYGDSAVAAQTVSMRHFDRMIDFDPDSGQLVAEAGVSLAGIIDAFLPRGWFPSVTPGTKFVTLGGAIAADVHGKNHHSEGAFSAFTDWFDLMGADGRVIRCSRDANAELFANTFGGMGLTGIILRAAIRLRRIESGWIRQTMIPARNLDEALEAFDETMDATYCVAWIDCLGTGDNLGRSLVMTGEHARPDELPPERRARPFDTPRHRDIPFPFDLPGFVLNPYTVRAFNALYYRMGARKAGDGLVDWDSYFYPLDAVQHWNRLYGRRGFMQFQCALPLEGGDTGLRRLLEAIARSGAASFLAVLKRFGPQTGPVSFPMEGYTLALDFPMNRRSLALMPELDRITIEHGGRLYLAKDSRMSRETLRQTDPRWSEFTRMRHEAGLDRRFASAQSQRLGL